MQLSGYRPSIQLRDLAIGIDNLRHDVFLSSKYVELVRNHASLLVTSHGAIQDLLMPGGLNPLRTAAPSNPYSREAARSAA